MSGPSDVVDDILSTVSTTYSPGDIGAIVPCDIPLTLTFQIGGKVKGLPPCRVQLADILTL
jgi:hypothetical protein